MEEKEKKKSRQVDWKQEYHCKTPKIINVLKKKMRD